MIPSSASPWPPSGWITCERCGEPWPPETSVSTLIEHAREVHASKYIDAMFLREPPANRLKIALAELRDVGRVAAWPDRFQRDVPVPFITRHTTRGWLTTIEGVRDAWTRWPYAAVVVPSDDIYEPRPFRLKWPRPYPSTPADKRSRHGYCCTDDPNDPDNPSFEPRTYKMGACAHTLWNHDARAARHNERHGFPPNGRTKNAKVTA